MEMITIMTTSNGKSICIGVVFVESPTKPLIKQFVILCYRYRSNSRWFYQLILIVENFYNSSDVVEEYDEETLQKYQSIGFFQKIVPGIADNNWRDPRDWSREMEYIESSSYNTFSHFKTKTKSSDIYRVLRCCLLAKKSKHS